MSREDLLGSFRDWFVGQLRTLTSLRTGVLCEVLLCARDLEAGGPRIDRAVHALGKVELPDHGRQNLVEALRRQFVFVRYGVEEKARLDFLQHWVIEGRVRNLENLVTISFFVNLALEQSELLPLTTLDSCRKWFVRQDALRSLRAKAWAPHCLRRAGFTELAAARAHGVIGERQSNGSWGHSLEKTLSTIYPLALSRTLDQGELEGSLRFVESQFALGVVDQDPELYSRALKAYAVMNLLPTALLTDIRRRSEMAGGLFISHSTSDKEFVRRLADDLEVRGIPVWFDEREIRPGDSIREKIEEGIEGMSGLAVVLSCQSVQSRWVKEELDMGLMEALSKDSLRIIPILLEDCEIPVSLRPRRWADFRAGYQVGLSDVLAALDVPENGEER